MDSPARHRLQRQFKEFKIDQKFQMVNSVMKAAIPGAQIFKKITADTAESNGFCYIIRPEWLCEEVI
jgi:hypothetical protein